MFQGYEGSEMMSLEEEISHLHKENSHVMLEIIINFIVIITLVNFINFIMDNTLVSIVNFIIIITLVRLILSSIE